MNCEHKRQNLLDYAYGELSPQHTEKVADVVKSCPACRTELDRIELVRGSFRDAMPLEEVPHLVHANILREARLKAYTEPPTVFERLQKLLFHPGFAAAAAVALVLLVSGVLFQPTLLESGKDEAPGAFAERSDSAAKADDEAAPAPPAAGAPASPAPVVAQAEPEGEAGDKADEAPLEAEVLALGGEPQQNKPNEPLAKELAKPSKAKDVWSVEEKPLARLDKKERSPDKGRGGLDDLLGGSEGRRNAKAPAREEKKAEASAPAPEYKLADKASDDAEALQEQAAAPTPDAAVVPADMDNLANAPVVAPEADEDAKAKADRTVKQAEWTPGYRPGNAASRAKLGSNSAVGFGATDAKGSGSGNAIYGQAQGDGGGPPAGADTKDVNAARKRFERGLSRYQRGDYGNAVKDFDAYLNDAPSTTSNYYALAMYYKGRSQLNRGNNAAAVKSFRRVITDTPTSEKKADARYWLAKALLRIDPSDKEAESILADLMSGRSSVAGNARDTYDRSFGKSSGKTPPRPGAKSKKRSKQNYLAPKKSRKSKSDSYYDSPDEKNVEALE